MKRVKNFWLVMSLALLGLVACKSNDVTPDKPKGDQDTTSTDTTTQYVEPVPWDNPQASFYKGIQVGFYNLENMMDTLNDPNTYDDEFTPKGANNWTSKRYHTKLAHMARVIRHLGDDDGLEFIGLAEVENRDVLKDLIAEDSLQDLGYSIIHYDSPDERGIDVAALYKTSAFTLLSSKPINVSFPEDPTDRTRDILFAGLKEKASGDTLYCYVMHWNSRGGGQAATEQKRIDAAKVAKANIDSLENAHPNARILAMGDLNDEPFNTSVADVLMGKKTVDALTDSTLYNPFYALSDAGEGSIKYRDDWQVFDQILMSPACVQQSSRIQYQDTSATIFVRGWMLQGPSAGSYEGYPDRTYVGSTYYGGYSDHLPVFIALHN